MVKLDRLDIRILSTLQAEGRLPNQALAERVGLSSSACLARLKKLEKSGVITGYGAKVAMEKLTPYSAVLVEFTLKQHRSEDFARFEAAMLALPQVVECYAVGGGIDYIAKFVTRSIEHYQQLIDALLDSDAGIDRYFSYFITKPVKQTPYPLDQFLADQT